MRIRISSLNSFTHIYDSLCERELQSVLAFDGRDVERVQLRLHPLLHLWVSEQVENKKVEGVAGGLLARTEQVPAERAQ